MEETKFEKMLYSKVSLCIGTASLVLGVSFWISNPQTALKLEITELRAQVASNQTVQEELSKIKNNDLHELQLRMDRIESRQIDQLQSTARIEALIDRIEKKID
jgi:hypothetical protein